MEFVPTSVRGKERVTNRLTKKKYWGLKVEVNLKKTKIAGIDPSLNHTGIVILDEDGNIIHQSLVEPKKLREIPRLKFIKDRVMEILKEHDIKYVSIESYSFGSRGRATFSLGELGGVLRLAFLEAGIEFKDYAPTSLKKFVTGSGNADKYQVRASIKEKYKIDFEDDNEADAYGLAQMLKAS